MQEDMVVSLFPFQVPWVWWPYTCLGRGWGGVEGVSRGTDHREVPTHILFPLGPEPEPRRGKGGVRIAKLFPGSVRTAERLPVPSRLGSAQLSFP